MVSFTKENMQYDDYQWTAYPSDDPRIIGKPDSTKFSRHEGYEVLYLINSLSEIWDFKHSNSCLKLEKMIREKLPSDVIMQNEVKNWLYKNWNN